MIYIEDISDWKQDSNTLVQSSYMISSVMETLVEKEKFNKYAEKYLNTYQDCLVGPLQVHFLCAVNQTFYFPPDLGIQWQTKIYFENKTYWETNLL